MRYLLRREGDPVSGWCASHGVFRTTLKRVRYPVPSFRPYGRYAGPRVLAGICPECQTSDPSYSRDNVRVLPLQSIPRVTLSESSQVEKPREGTTTPISIRTWAPAIDALDLACYAFLRTGDMFAREEIFVTEMRLLSDIQEDIRLAERIVDLITLNIGEADDGKMLMLLMLDDEERTLLRDMAKRVGLSVHDMSAGICLSALLRANEADG